MSATVPAFALTRHTSTSPHPKGSGPLNAVAGHGDVYRLKKGVIRFDVESVLQGL